MTGPVAGTVTTHGTAGPYDGPAGLRARPKRTGHLVDEGLAIACFLAPRPRRPLLCEGDTGVGRTAFAPALAAVVPDRSGGTRLGGMPRAFPGRRGQRFCARGAVVVVLSYGWERTDPAPLAARMRRSAHRVARTNPRETRPGHAPLAAGVAAAPAHGDAFVEGHGPAAPERPVAGVRGEAFDA
ncbi:VWA domain-containing protein [Streptomyces sp. NPDC002403]